ncbi:hypothetical protein [Nocardia terpenica]|uniref:Uncharacterized protein n=1 Tax=Nocardia terpenica TaxID=455432 RepID=A0A161WNS3_9NOCA|nr:hypothetical protein [Nocardia terpenica]KZM74735.1 hypothetical protein AWN90_22035 [Nocardia terpenica]
MVSFDSTRETAVAATMASMSGRMMVYSPVSSNKTMIAVIAARVAPVPDPVHLRQHQQQPAEHEPADRGP